MNYQQTNWLFDEVMPQVSGNAFKIICAVARKTWGWNKNADAISISQFADMLGTSSRSNTIRSINAALETGFISRTKSKRQSIYRMNFNQSDSTKTVPYSNDTVEGSTKIVPSGSTKTVPQVVPKQYPQHKERIKKETSSNGLGAVYSAYENNIGTLTPIICDMIEDAVKDYGGDAVTKAIGIAAKNNVRKWNYVNGVLKRGVQTELKKVNKTDDGGLYV